MKRTIVILLPLCLLYLLVGAILMWTGLLEQQTYLAGAGIVGAIASVLGLLSLLRPALTMSDIQYLEVESLQKLSDVSSETKKLEDARSHTATQITDLETKRKEMELLVRKASMSLFLKDQYERHMKRILEHLKKESGLLSSISELSSIEKKLAALDEEIERNENVDLLRQIIDAARTTVSPFDKAIENASLPLRIFLQIIRAYAGMFGASLGK
ncbi:MAG: hypothetical protein HQ592_18625 [Planctomycetes bacterium]|nr:hypothetical protein [Planctomycetota bacterium]